MWKDQIVDEVRKIRDRRAARLNYDVDAIIADVKSRFEAQVDKMKGEGNLLFVDLNL